MAEELPDAPWAKPKQQEELPDAPWAQPAKRQNTTVLDYPEIYKEMRQESQGQMARGVEQLTTPLPGASAAQGYWTGLKGWGNIGLGALGYVGSPIAAGIRSVVGEPLEQRTGFPKEYSEFATSLAIPGIGLPRVPGSPAPNVATKITGPSTGKIAEEGRLLTKGGQETQAGLALREAATDPAKAERVLGTVDEIIPGSKPTTFQASKDYGLGQLERGVQTKAQAPFAERRAEQGVARIKALESAEQPGNPEEVANHIRARIQANDVAAEAAEQAAIARAEQETQAAIRRAERAGQSALGTNTPEIYGQILRRELNEANNAARTNERTLWQSVDPEARLSVNTAPVMNAEFRIYRDQMTQAGAASLSDAERTIGGVIQRYGQAVPFREMQDLRSLVSSAMRQEIRLNGNSPAYARMSRLRGAIEESVSAPFEPGVPASPGQAALSADAADRLAQATAATRARAETFKQQPIKGVLQREGATGPYPLTNAAVPGRIIPSGPKGYDHVNAYLRATEGRPGGGLSEITDALVADMRASATVADGSIDPNRLMSWAKGKQDALRAVSERDGGALVQTLQEIEEAGRGVKTATGAQKLVVKEASAQRAAASKAETQGIFGDLAGVRDKGDISKVIGSIFGSKTAEADAAALMARLGTPEAQDGARRAITDWITNKLVSNTAAGTTEVNILRADQFQQFVKQNVAVLEKFGFTPEQIKTWQAIAADMRQAKMSIDATKVPGGSNTAQDLYAMKKFGLAGSKLSKILHVAGTAIGGVTGGWIGALAGFFGAGKYAALREAGVKSVQDLIVQGMLDPAFGRQLLTKVTPQENIAFMRTMGMYGKRAVRAEALTGSRHDQSASSKGYAYGGTVFPVGREGIQARNKARAFEAREGSTLARGAAQAKRKVKYQSGGSVPYAIGSPEFKDEVARGLAKNPDTIAAAQEFYPRVPLNDKAWSQFIEDAPSSINIEDRRGLRGAFRKADGGPIRMAHHEQSETIQNDKGEWVNVYGKATPQAGKQLPDTPTYPTVDEAVDAARKRSEEYGKEHEGFASGGVVKDDSRKASKKSVNYSKGMPKAHCGICTHFSKGTCSEVKGTIYASMWCELFKRKTKYAEGGVVEEDPLDAEIRRRNVPGGLSATAGPTVTSTTPVQDIPAPKVNTQGETAPTYILKEIGKQIVGTPERLTHVGGDLQRRGEYAGSHEDLPSFGPPPEEMPAGLEIATGLYGLNAPFPKPGIGVFGGRGAKTANLEKLKQAEKMQGEGVPHADIRKETGWEFGVDEQPRFEMSDANARVQPTQQTGVLPLEQFINHPEYFQDYPHLKNVPVEWDIRPGLPERGATGVGPNGQVVGIKIQAPDLESARSVALHEMTHPVQEFEGFASGASPDALPLTDYGVQHLTKQMAEDAGYKWSQLPADVKAQMEKEFRYLMYSNYAGEAEARNVQTRRDYSSQKRQETPSWETEDVARDQQLVPRGPGDLAGPGGNPFKEPKVYESVTPPEQPLLKPGPVDLGAFPTTTPRKILKETKQGGYSVRVPTGERPTEGLMMGIYRNTDPRNLVVEGRAPTQADVRQHATRNIQALQKPERHYGTWKDPETGITYFDVSQRFPAGNIRQATKFGERTGQLSGYNVGKGETFPVGNWERFITDPEFHNRVIEQAQRGREYLSQYPAKEWWDMHGGPFESVYGTQNMPQTAGLTASTAPNTKPIENLQHMSEYMRRHISGEPVVQPTWRAPEGLMSLAAGKKMPLEQSRVANLVKAAAGRLDELQMRKVRSEALAMWGDPRAVVLDRHWARIGEAPERGIYTATTEGIISSRPLKGGRLSPYEIMENEIIKIADSLGRDPRDFSADGWTGIRETIRTTGELYGQRFRGSAIQGESKSYADHFVDLIQRKAGHLRISVNELERRLRAGDTSLLSQMLAMPTIAGAFSYWLAGQGNQEQNGDASSAGSRAMPSTL